MEGGLALFIWVGTQVVEEVELQLPYFVGSNPTLPSILIFLLFCDILILQIIFSFNNSYFL